MKLKYQSTFLNIYADSKNDTLRIIANKIENDETMQEEEYISYILSYLNISNEVRPKYLLSDVRYLEFIISPQLQEWTNKEIIPKSVLIEKSAIVVSKDTFTQIATENSMEKYEKGFDGKLVTKYFETVEQAEAWLYG